MRKIELKCHNCGDEITEGMIHGHIDERSGKALVFCIKLCSIGGSRDDPFTPEEIDAAKGMGSTAGLCRYMNDHEITRAKLTKIWVAMGCPNLEDFQKAVDG